jgi:GAF domain-containing protein
LVIADQDTARAALLRLARAVTARHDLDDVLAEAFRSLRPLVPFGGGSIQLIDDEGWIQMAASDPAAPAHVMAQRVPLGTSIAGRVILTEQPVYLPDLQVAELPGPGRRVSSGVRSYFGIPLVVDGAAIGVLQVDSIEPDAWSEEHRSLLVTVAPIVAAAIQNARAHARAGAARARADAADQRVREAQHVAATARACLEAADLAELDRQLARLESVLAGESVESVTGLRVPRQRAAAQS